MNLEFDTLPANANINDIKVPDHLRVRIDTGLDFLNFVKSGDAEEQGLVPGEAILFTGTPGAGKSTLSLQLADALTRSGHTVLFNGVEESPAQTKMTYERLGLKAGFNIRNSIFVDKPTGPKDLIDRVGDNYLLHHLQDVHATYSREHGRKNIKNRPHMVLIVDSLQGMNDGKYGFASNSKTPVRVLEELCNFAKTNFVTVIAIGHVGKSGEFKGDNTLLHMADSHLHLHIDVDPKSDTEGCRLLECRKNRFGPSGITAVLDIGRNGLREHSSRGKRLKGMSV